MGRTLVVLALGLAACEDERAVARVGDTVLTRADVAHYRQSRGGEPEAALDALVDRALLAEGAERAGLLEDPAVAARVAEARREVLANAYLDQVAGKAGSEEALRQRYEAQKDSLARKQVNVAHLVVRLPPEADARARTEARARINALYARVVGGEDFAAVAREASEDAVTGARGGELGPVQEGQVDPRFFSAVAELKQGEVSKPFETAFGLHVARALEAPRT
ncbi:MAG TPA: peptidylprolyl isomerase, partial [Myxococcus sp.]|nr:peptidylprolyl isomerase [Myxococcus sp.]